MHQAATLPSFGDVLNIVSQLPLQDKAALMEFLQQTVPLSRHSEIRKLNSIFMISKVSEKKSGKEQMHRIMSIRNAIHGVKAKRISIRQT